MADSKELAEVVSEVFSFLAERAEMRRENRASLDNIDKFSLYHQKDIENNRYIPLQERDAKILGIWAREMNEFVKLAHSRD
jgi:hypothetical protein